MELMRKCNPPVGWGKLCPQTVAYKVRLCVNVHACIHTYIHTYNIIHTYNGQNSSCMLDSMVYSKA